MKRFLEAFREAADASPGENPLRRIFTAYRELVGILFAESPVMVIATFAASLLAGALTPLSLWVNARIFNLGLEVAGGTLAFASYIPNLALFAALALLPAVINNFFIYSYVEPRCQLILRTAYKGKMLQKLKKLKYEHFENDASMEIIDKAYNRTENAARHLFPMYIFWSLSSLVASAGTLYLFASVRWWLLLAILIPFALETWLSIKYFYNIYDELEHYWNRERRYSTLAGMLRSRDYIKENRLFRSSDYLIGAYRDRLAARNREYEQFYFKHLRRHFTQQNITKIAQLGSALLLLWLFLNGNLSIGLLITLTLSVFNGLFQSLSGCMIFFRASGYHIKSFVYYEKYFSLSEDSYGDTENLPGDCSIEFDDVRFTYPGTDREILKGLSFTVKHGEKVSLVGQNGEGKTTMVKLLLGLFQPTGGEIRIGGKPLSAYSPELRRRIFGPVFQDFIKYSISLGENVGIGDVDNMARAEAVSAAMEKGGVDFANSLENGADTLLGRDFEGGVDLSGGQWQRVAIARAFMGDKPILILDEPTSQLDPMAESRIYSDFAGMAAGKTAIFITHRLGSTMITDRILVIAEGRVVQSGSHAELMREGGLYADMFNSQKQWYEKTAGGAEHAE
ncbi:MAG: ABC transporter ATP-binding protein/permease [Treponema sp.]|jgi:ATP-binding cassette subfamily B protein|nr:ABC transporter ATP-binding protein/permease [Treponema sp.]